MKHKYHYIIVTIVLLLIIIAIGPRTDLSYSIEPVNIPANVENYISSSEKRFSDIVPGTEKKIVWAGPAKKPVTNVSIVYIHGFSASRREIAPIPDMLSKFYGANLFYTRLTGHGRGDNAMKNINVNALLHDAKEALEVGKQIGKKVILIGTSTGGSLSTWLAAHENSENIAAVILLSPNYGLKRKESELLLYPWGETLLRIIEGEYYQFEPVNAQQEKYWTTRYPSRALLGMLGITKVLRQTNLVEVHSPVLLLYNEGDKIVDTVLMKEYFSRFSSSTKKILEIKNTADPQKHVLAGDILSPGTNQQVFAAITGFLTPVLDPSTDKNRAQMAP